MMHKSNNPYNTDYVNRKRQELDRRLKEASKSAAEIADMLRATNVYLSAMMNEHYGLPAYTQRQMADAAGMAYATFRRHLANARKVVELP